MRKRILALFLILAATPQIATAIPNCIQETPDFAACGNGCYWDISSNQCTVCPAGTINTKYGQIQCTPCGIGEFSDINRTKCNKCATIENGVIEYDDVGLATQYSCPGTATCNAGYFWLFISGVNTSRGCTKCPANTIAPNQSTITIPGGTTGWPRQSDTSKCTACPTNETSTDGITCVCTGNFELVNGECTGRVYKITLDRNMNFADKAKEIWIKYATGYATSKDATNWLPNGTGTTPTYHWTHKFNGYYTTKTGGDQVFNESGFATTNYVATSTKAREFFTGDKTLYAHWDAKKYYVKFLDTDGKTTIQTTTCTFGSNCYTPSIAVQAGQYGNWKCVSGCNAFDSTDPLKPNSKIPEPKENTTYNITMQKYVNTCPYGYYCNYGIQNKCPDGTSTSGTGKSTRQDCGYVRGSNGTKFCDNSGVCFTLPGTGIIQKLN